ncbi:MAG TPA: S53 family peptidase [Ktedonobacterales bacterium]
MSEHSSHTAVPVPGSERSPLVDALPGARHVGPVHPDERIEVSVYLRPQSGGAPQPDQRLTREEYAARFGASPDDVEKVEAFAHEHDLTVVQTDLARRLVVLAGPASALQQAFGVNLQRYEHETGSYRSRSGPVLVPAELAPLVEGVFGLDNRPQARIRARYAVAAPATTYTPPQVARLYNFPTQGNGKGESIALVELGGGYRRADLKTYFGQLGLAVPKVSSVSVDGGHNHPTTPQGADGEVALDIEVAGGVAPGAHIVVYFAPNTDRGFLDAITQATHDTKNKPSVISISWGSPESNWTDQAMQAMDQAFQAAGALGVTICCAAGDGGASDGAGDHLAHVDFPASSPHALACGGTQLVGANGTVSSETVWNDQNGSATGGGVSDVFPLPTWQQAAKIPTSINPGGRVGRGVPDVAANADPQTGYDVLVDGQASTIGGTSAVAPLWAGLVALLNQQLGKPIGWLNPVLYQQVDHAATFRDIVTGGNDGYSAGPEWDACTGWGAVNGAALLEALTRLL